MPVNELFPKFNWFNDVNNPNVEGKVELKELEFRFKSVSEIKLPISIGISPTVHII